METVLALVLALVVLALVLEPLVRGRPWPGSEDAGSSEVDLEFTDLEESESEKIQALLALREIEFDRATGKLSDEDYLSLKTKYQQEALKAIEIEDAGPLLSSEAGELDSAEKMRDGTAICPACGPRPESSAQFCSDCGRQLVGGESAATCSKCGEPREPAAKFCGECGTKF